MVERQSSSSDGEEKGNIPDTRKRAVQRKSKIDTYYYQKRQRGQ